MKKDEKVKIIDTLSEKIKSYQNFYLADISDLDAVDTSSLRRLCHKSGIKLVVVKNTLLYKAIEKNVSQATDLKDVLKGHTSVMFCEDVNKPAKIIKEFRRTNKKPILKAAYVQESLYIGDSNLDALINLKSKNDLIGDIILALQSPAKNVISALLSGGNTLHGILETLEKKQE